MPRTILLVDDEELVLRSIARWLRSMGHQVSAQPSAESALVAAAQQPFDVALTDLKMPGMSGMQFIREMSERHSSIPVVVLSGLGTPGEEEQAMRLGAVAYVEKPSRPERLRAVLESVFETRRPT